MEGRGRVGVAQASCVGSWWEQCTAPPPRGGACPARLLLPRTPRCTHRVCVAVDDVCIVGVAVGLAVPLHHPPPGGCGEGLKGWVGGEEWRQQGAGRRAAAQDLQRLRHSKLHCWTDRLLAAHAPRLHDHFSAKGGDGGGDLQAGQRAHSGAREACRELGERGRTDAAGDGCSRGACLTCSL